MKVAYVVNQYPHVSHAFIRREIAALEALGVEVTRFSVRPPPVSLVDPGDQVVEVAVQEGATIVRIGTALFGAR